MKLPSLIILVVCLAEAFAISVKEESPKSTAAPPQKESRQVSRQLEYISLINTLLRQSNVLSSVDGFLLAITTVLASFVTRAKPMLIASAMSYFMYVGAAMFFPGPMARMGLPTLDLSNDIRSGTAGRSVEGGARMFEGAFAETFTKGLKMSPIMNIITNVTVTVVSDTMSRLRTFSRILVTQLSLLQGNMIWFSRALSHECTSRFMCRVGQITDTNFPAAASLLRTVADAYPGMDDYAVAVVRGTSSSNCSLLYPDSELVLNRPNMRIIRPKMRLDRCDQCDPKYFKHYETKLCIPVYDEGCKCPKRFDCPELPTDVDTTVCTYKGKTYAKGESIPTSNPCESCSCRGESPTSTAYMICALGECGTMFRGPVEGCYDVYEKGECCPTTTKCFNDSTSYYKGQIEPTCEFEGKKYYLGQQMPSKEDDCLTCLCDKDFQDKHSTSCRIYDCERELEKQLPLFKRGCIPIYHEETCCPIEFRCPYGNEVRIPGPNARFMFYELDPLSHCTFNGKSYSIGDKMDISHPTNCVTCTCMTPPDITCMTPPDITCIHRSCKSPANYKHRNYQSIYVPGQCCSKHHCT